jgi:hypothetical protein
MKFFSFLMSPFEPECQPLLSSRKLLDEFFILSLHVFAEEEENEMK